MKRGIAIVLGIAVILFLILGMYYLVIAKLGPLTAGNGQGGMENVDEDPHSIHGSHSDHDHEDGHDGAHDDGESSEDEDDHAHGGEAHEDDVVNLTESELEEFGIEVLTAKPGKIVKFVELPGEIVLNADRLAHVVPRLSGIVREVKVKVGDSVRAGNVLAVIDSQELAEAKSAFLAATEREKLAAANFQREEKLWEKKITSELEYLEAKQTLAEARITRNAATQQLLALGIPESSLEKILLDSDPVVTRFVIRAPFGGTIIEKHIALGERVGAETDIFTVADLSTVWVNVSIYQKDLAAIRKGQTVAIDIGHDIPEAKGTIAWISPHVDEATRTALARVVLPNPDGLYRPGLFLTAKIATSEETASVVVPKGALQTFEGRTVVFVQTNRGFEPVPVEVGQENTDTVEIASGLAEGQHYVSKGAFTLKATLEKGAFGDGHNH